MEKIKYYNIGHAIYYMWNQKGSFVFRTPQEMKREQ